MVFSSNLFDREKSLACSFTKKFWGAFFFVKKRGKKKNCTKHFVNCRSKITGKNRLFLVQMQCKDPRAEHGFYCARMVWFLSKISGCCSSVWNSSLPCNDESKNPT